MSFSDELKKATDSLKQFNEELSRRAREQPRDELGRFVAAGAGGRPGIAGLALGAAATGSVEGGVLAAMGGPAGMALAAGSLALRMGAEVARFATPGANAFAITGSTQAVAASVNQQLLDRVGNTAIGGFALAVSGVASAREVTGRAGARVGAVTEDLARAGVNVSDDYRQRLASTAIEQERRVERERAKVAALTGSADALEKAMPEHGFGGEAILAVLRNIERALTTRSGGAP